jgi:hypothetical protein
LPARRSCPLSPRLAAALTLLLSLGAGPLPASSLERDAEILIHSQPEGAAVMALGKTWGVTPMRLRVRDAFPALYRPEQPYIGMAIHLGKEGCSEYRFPIHRRSIPTEIHAELDCAQATTPAATPAAEPAPPAQPAPAQPPAAAPPKSVRAKLEELEQLRRDGLVTEDEYQKLRKRVLEYF